MLINESDYSHDVTDDLKALSCCCQREDSVAGCCVCPFIEHKLDGFVCSPYYRLIDTLKEILLQLSGEKAEHFLAVIDNCSLCEEYSCDPCLYYDESIEINADVFYRHVYDFLMEQGLYNADGTVSEKGKQIRISDDLALYIGTRLTKDDWPKERGGLTY